MGQARAPQDRHPSLTRSSRKVSEQITQRFSSAYRAPRPSKHLIDRAAAILPMVERRLRAAYGAVARGSTPLGNKRDPLEELIYIQLSVRTRESAYLDTYQALRHFVRGHWERLLRSSDARLLRILDSGGMARVKLARLRGQLAGLQARFGSVTLAPLRGMDDHDAEAVLRDLSGVGPKVARCVLLYSLDRDVFPVDSNCRRVLDRLGFVPTGMSIKAGHDFIQALVPKRIRRSLHVNLIRHGRDVCLPGIPVCEACSLLSLCHTGQVMMGLGPDAEGPHWMD